MCVGTSRLTFYMLLSSDLVVWPFCRVDVIFAGETSADTWIEKEVRYNLRLTDFQNAVLP